MKAKGSILILLLLAVGALSYGILHRSFSSGDFSRTFEFSYVVRISDIPADAEKVSVIIPVPQSDDHQIISDVSIEADNTHTYLTDGEYGNKVARIDLDRENIGRHFEARMTFLANR